MHPPAAHALLLWAHVPRGHAGHRQGDGHAFAREVFQSQVLYTMYSVCVFCNLQLENFTKLMHFLIVFTSTFI